jgi:hypothetical protein
MLARKSAISGPSANHSLWMRSPSNRECNSASSFRPPLGISPITLRIWQDPVCSEARRFSTRPEQKPILTRLWPSGCMKYTAPSRGYLAPVFLGLSRSDMGTGTGTISGIGPSDSRSPRACNWSRSSIWAFRPYPLCRHQNQYGYFAASSIVRHPAFRRTSRVLMDSPSSSININLSRCRPDVNQQVSTLWSLFPVAEAAPGPEDGPTAPRRLPWWIRLLVGAGILVRRP